MVLPGRLVVAAYVTLGKIDRSALASWRRFNRDSESAVGVISFQLHDKCSALFFLFRRWFIFLAKTKRIKI